MSAYLVSKLRDKCKGDVWQVLRQALQGGHGGVAEGPVLAAEGGRDGETPHLLARGDLTCCLSPRGIKERGCNLHMQISVMGRSHA